MPLQYPPSSGGGASPPFGASDLTDRTRSFWKGAQDFVLCTGTPAQAVTATFQWPHWALDAASNESIVTTIHIPLDFVASGAITVKVFYYTGDANAGNIQLGILGRPISNGNNLDIDAYPANPGTTCAAPGAANQMKVVTITTSAFTGGGAVAGEAAQIQLLRYATDPGDTYASDVLIAGLMFEYTADS